MNITQNVFKLECTKGAYAYAVKDSDGVTLIDTCAPGRGAAILKELEANGIKPQDVKRILITHADTDHIGNIGFLTEKCGCDVYISAEDIPYAKGEKKQMGLRRILALIQKVNLPQLLHTLPDGKIGSIEIIPAPGHTPGHVCFRFENVLFVGDLVRGRSNVLVDSPNVFMLDKAQNAISMKAISTDGIDWICMAHGEPVQTHPAWENYLKGKTKK